MRLAIANLLLALAVAGCDRGPLTVTAVNESSPPSAARIKLVPTQVFKRETLINDRTREREYLVKQLENSDREACEPEIARDIQTITELAGQVGISANPSEAADAERLRERTSAEQQIALAELQARQAKIEEEYRRLQEAIKASQTAQVPPSADGSSPSLPTVGGQPSTSPGTAQSSAPPTSPTVDDVVKRLSLAVPSLTGSTGVDRTKSKASLLDILDCQEAVRNRIRSRLNAVVLDDVHDDFGNKLYRVQLRATIFPGERKDQWGATRLIVDGPSDMTSPKSDSGSPLSEEDTNRLYAIWLAHLTERLTSLVSISPKPTTTGESSEDDLDPRDVRIEGLAKLSGAFIVLPFYFGDSADDDCATLPHAVAEAGATHSCRVARIAVNPLFFTRKYYDFNDIRPVPEGSKAFLDDVVTFLTDETQVESYRKRTIFRMKRVKRDKFDEWRCDHIENDTDLASLLTNRLGFDNRTQYRGLSSSDEAVQISKQVLRTVGSVTSAIDALQRIPNLPVSARQRLTRYLSAYEHLFDDAKTIIEQVAILNKPKPKEHRCAKFTPERFITQGAEAPPEFGAALGNALHNPDSRAYVYGVSPSSQTQSISTLASASDTLALALALKAALPTKGLAGTGESTFLQNSMSKLDAFESMPIVMGYLDTYSTDSTGSTVQTDLNKGKATEVGWIFGPRIVLDASKNNLRHEQVLSSQELSIDISVPAWWPRIRLRQQSAWIGNWGTQKDHDLIGDAFKSTAYGSNVIDVPLPTTSADLDNLTDQFAEIYLGRKIRRTLIRSVEPSVLRQCSDPLNIQIYGENLWREPSVYLQGQQGTQITILPDMNGINVQFNLNEIKPSVADYSALKLKLKLTVVTSTGPAYAEIAVDCARSPASKQ